MVMAVGVSPSEQRDGKLKQFEISRNYCTPTHEHVSLRCGCDTTDNYDYLGAASSFVCCLYDLLATSNPLNPTCDPFLRRHNAQQSALAIMIHLLDILH